jgi:hypothetical protein
VLHQLLVINFPRLLLRRFTAVRGRCGLWWHGHLAHSAAPSAIIDAAAALPKHWHCMTTLQLSLQRSHCI